MLLAESADVRLSDARCVAPWTSEVFKSKE